MALGINFWTLGRTFITSDEGWYMYLFFTKEVHSASHAHLLFDWIPGLDSLYSNRLTSFILKELSIVLFCFGYHRWLRKVVAIKVPLLLVFGLAALSQLYIESCPTINYTILTQVFMLSGLGVLFYAMVTGHTWLYVICGFLLSMLFLVQATCVLIVIFVISAIWLLQGFKETTYFALGGMVGLAFLVFVIESPQQVYAWIAGVIADTRRPENFQYQNGNLLQWLINGAKHYFKWLLMAWMLVMLHHTVVSVIRTGKNLARKRIIAFGVGATALFLYMWIFLYPYAWDMSMRVFVRNIMWVCIMLACYFSWLRYKSKHLLVVMLLLMITPLFMSFGSNAAFLVRHVTVYVSVIMVVGIMLDTPAARWFRWATILMMSLMLGNCAIVPFVNWQHQRYSAQDIELSDAGYRQHVKVDRQYIDNLDFFKAKVPEGAEVIVSVDTWSAAYLLNYHALRHDYRLFSTPLISSIIDEALDADNAVYILFTIDEYSGDTEQAIWGGIIDELSHTYNIDVQLSTGVGFAKVWRGK